MSCDMGELCGEFRHRAPDHFLYSESSFVPLQVATACHSRVTGLPGRADHDESRSVKLGLGSHPAESLNENNESEEVLAVAHCNNGLN